MIIKWAERKRTERIGLCPYHLKGDSKAFFSLQFGSNAPEQQRLLITLRRILGGWSCMQARTVSAFFGFVLNAKKWTT